MGGVQSANKRMWEKKKNEKERKKERKERKEKVLAPPFASLTHKYQWHLD